MDDWISGACDQVDILVEKDPYFRELDAQSRELEPFYLKILDNLSPTDREIIVQYEYPSFRNRLSKDPGRLSGRKEPQAPGAAEATEALIFIIGRLGHPGRGVRAVSGSPARKRGGAVMLTCKAWQHD